MSPYPVGFLQVPGDPTSCTEVPGLSMVGSLWSICFPRIVLHSDPEQRCKVGFLEYQSSRSAVPWSRALHLAYHYSW